MNISAQQVKDLREKTGAPMMDCKQALTEAKGDMEQAVQDVFAKINADKKTRVNTILFVQNKEEEEANKESEPLMQGIAHNNGGVMKWVIADEL